jgi:FkbM family methyltransferase
MIRRRIAEWNRYRNLFRRVENPTAYLRHKFGFDRGDEVELTLEGGLKVRVPARRLVEFKEIVMGDAYLVGFRPTAWDFTAPLTIVDVGANLGFFSLYAKSRFPRSTVVGVEPLPGNFAFFRDNLVLNPSLAGSVRAVNEAVAATAGTLRLRSRRGGQFPTDATLWTEHGEGEVFEVPATTLGDLLARERIDRLSLLKLDCEGAEFEIVYRTDPAVLARVEAIAMEVHPGPGADDNMEAIGRFLARHGFACCFATKRDFVWAARDAGRLVSVDLAG